MSDLSDFYNYGKVQIHFPNQVSRMIRLSDLVPAAQSTSHGGIASYTYVGDLGDAIVDPGIGNCGVTSEADDWFGMQLVISTTDKNGLDVSWSLMMMFFFGGLLEYQDLFIYIRSTSDPKRYWGLYVFDFDTIVDEDDDIVGFVFNVFPTMASMTYDAETDEYTSVDIPNNDEVVMSWDLCFNPDYLDDLLGTMAYQNADSVSISGGTISTPVNIYLAEGVPDVDPGWASSSTIDMNVPDGYGSFLTEEGVSVVVPYWIKRGA